MIDAPDSIDALRGRLSAIVAIPVTPFGPASGVDWDVHAALIARKSIRLFEELRADDASADNVSVVKEALAQLGLAPRDVRPPSRLLPHDRRDLIATLIARWKEEGWL
jgi:dihydrodipicolinate synthase/N-acetylneuraminate lyase